MNDDKFFLAALGGATSLGNKSIATLVKFFGSAKAAWFADVADLHKTGVRVNALAALVNFRAYNPDAPETLADYCDRQKIGVCSIFDDDYPPLLKATDSPPVFFYYRGNLQPCARRIAVVGSRRSTDEKNFAALQLGDKLAGAGLTIVSGAANGIDTFAHLGAIQSGRTVAVLGCGLGCKLPHKRAELLDQIAKNGVVISEFALHVTPTAGTLVARNRVIAGLASALIVVDSGIKSGALIAAKHAADYGRPVFVVAHSVDGDGSEGCKKLIRDGAPLVNCLDEIINKVKS